MNLREQVVATVAAILMDVSNEAEPPELRWELEDVGRSGIWSLRVSRGDEAVFVTIDDDPGS